MNSSTRLRSFWADRPLSARLGRRLGSGGTTPITPSFTRWGRSSGSATRPDFASIRTNRPMARISMTAGAAITSFIRLFEDGISVVLALAISLIRVPFCASYSSCSRLRRTVSRRAS